MARKLIACIQNMTEAQRETIRAAALRHGFEPCFPARAQDALPFAEEIEIAFCDSPVLSAAAPGLRWQCTPSAGINQFTAPGAFLNPDAVLTNSSGAYGVTIAEHIIMVTLELLRRQREYTEIVAGRRWIRALPVRSIHGSRVTLLGTGDIGTEAAIRLRAFSPAGITGVSRSGRAVPVCDRVLPVSRLDEALPETDLLILSLPGTPETTRLLSAGRLGLLPDGAVIVNVGRGVTIDQAALERELRAGRLQAALDVFEREPIPPEDPLWTCPNLLITPHNAGNMSLPYTVERAVAMFLEDLEHYAAGRPLAHTADVRRGY